MSLCEHYSCLTAIGANEETSTNAMNHLQTTPFYLDVKLIGPIFLSLIALVAMSVSACICYRKSTCHTQKTFFQSCFFIILNAHVHKNPFVFHTESPVDGQSNQNLSVGSPSSSLYFKHNPNHTLLQQHHQQHVAHLSIRGAPQQVYMTVKKATPMTGVDMTDIQAVPRKIPFLKRKFMSLLFYFKGKKLNLWVRCMI